MNCFMKVLVFRLVRVLRVDRFVRGKRGKSRDECVNKEREFSVVRLLQAHKGVDVPFDIGDAVDRIKPLDEISDLGPSL